ncbi:MAG: type II secretion system protein [Kiritimatiellae bacterium]|nr:type II secretion system protein [Kiritimatiellia bacterium]
MMRKVFKKSGFTLVELLVVMGIIGILMALLFPAIGAARKAALKAQAQTEVRAIATAIEAYFNEYGKLPIPDDYQGKSGGTGGASPCQRGTYWTVNVGTNASMQIIKILTASDTKANGANDLDTALYDRVMNPRKIVFLEAQNSEDPAEAVAGIFLDPWGYQYMIAMDSDYNGKMEFFNNQQEILTKNVVVYSFGPTGVLPADAAAIVLPGDDAPDVVASSFE